MTPSYSAAPSPRLIGKAVVLALAVGLWQGISGEAALMFLALCLLYVTALPFLLLGDVFDASAARLALTHLIRLPQVLRAHQWHGVWVRRVRMVPGGMSYLVQPPPGLTAEAQDRVKRDGPGRLGVFEVTVKAGRRAGSVWVTLCHRDPLEDDRRWTRTTARGGGVVGRLASGPDLVLGPHDGHIAVQGMTQVGKTYLCRMVVWFWRSWGYPVCGSDQSGDLLTDGSDRLTAGDADKPAAHLAVLEALVAMMDELLTARRLGQSEFVPRLVVVEELPGLLAKASAEDAAHGRKGTERLAPRLELALGRLAAESRKVGFTLLLVAQRFDASLLGGAVRNNFAVRLSLRGDRASVAMLHADVPDHLVKRQPTLPPGFGLVEMPGTEVTRFRIDRWNYSEPGPADPVAPRDPRHDEGEDGGQPGCVFAGPPGGSS
jgi:hypothetical protein